MYMAKLTTVSMIDGRMLDMLNQLGVKIRGQNKPFGGLQVSQAPCKLTSDDNLRGLLTAPSSLEERR
jgi:hypothetical protein